MTKVSLVHMSQTEYDAYYPGALENLSEELAQARNLPRFLAIELARQSFSRIYPDGKIDVPDQFIFNVLANGVTVGVLHFGVNRDEDVPYVYVWDITVKEEYRGMGYGEATMLALENYVRQNLGLYRIKLNVFGHNTTALGLYDKLNYRPAALTMVKSL